MSKFHIIFPLLQYENLKWKSLVLLLGLLIFAVRNLQLSISELQFSAPRPPIFSNLRQQDATPLTVVMFIYSKQWYDTIGTLVNSKLIGCYILDRLSSHLSTAFTLE